MPKLNTLQIFERLENQINQMRNGEALALRDIKAILGWVGDEYVAWIDEEKDRQRELKKKHRKPTEQEKAELGIRTAQEILMEAQQRAMKHLRSVMLDELEKEQKEKEHRQARKFLAAYSEARNEDKDSDSAWLWANNELTRANLPRVDGIKVSTDSRRDKEVWTMEDGLKAKFREEMTDDEREQQDLLAEVNGEIGKKTKKKAKK